MMKKQPWLGVLTLILVICALSSLVLLFSRMAVYSAEAFENVMPLYETDREDGVSYAPVVSYAASDTQTVTGADDASTDAADSSEPETTPDADTPNADTSDTDSLTSTSPASGNQSSGSQSSGGSMTAHPEFRMTAEAEIFKFSYDETGKLTVISNNSGEDKLIAPGTSNKYQFTLENPGNVALDYYLTMEAYVTGTELSLPVKVSVRDYKNKYLLGTAEEMADVLLLNSVNDTAELGAGRYAVYTLEWEWPFEWGDDEYDTQLGNLAVEDDIVLTVVIRTVAEYDEEPDDPTSGLPPQTGDDSKIMPLVILCAVSLFGACAVIFVGGRRENETRKMR